MFSDEILKKLKEPFPIEKIMWRAQTINREGTKALALAYIDARLVMDRLDEVFGQTWECRYHFSHDSKKTICAITINGITREDGAADTEIEADKGAISDAFKRAAVKWGIGRFLYDMPIVWVPCESYQDLSGKRKFKRFTVDPWHCVGKVHPEPPIVISDPSVEDFERRVDIRHTDGTMTVGEAAKHAEEWI